MRSLAPSFRHKGDHFLVTEKSSLYNISRRERLFLLSALATVADLPMIFRKALSQAHTRIHVETYPRKLLLRLFTIYVQSP